MRGVGDGVMWVDKAIFIQGVTYQSDGKDLADGVEYLYRGAKLVS